MEKRITKKVFAINATTMEMTYFIGKGGKCIKMQATNDSIKWEMYFLYV